MVQANPAGGLSLKAVAGDDQYLLTVIATAFSIVSITYWMLSWRMASTGLDSEYG
jgi:hypothetical protein